MRSFPESDLKTFLKPSPWVGPLACFPHMEFRKVPFSAKPKKSHLWTATTMTQPTKEIPTMETHTTQFSRYSIGNCSRLVQPSTLHSILERTTTSTMAPAIIQTSRLVTQFILLPPRPPSYPTTPKGLRKVAPPLDL